MEHFVQFYEADAFLVDAVGDFIAAGLRANEAAVVVATQAHRNKIAARLQRQGHDLAIARTDGRYVALDAAGLLPRFMRAGMPDRGRFTQVFGDIIARASGGHRPVRVFGEMVALLAAAQNHAAALRLEQLWNALAATHSFTLFCGYPIDGFSESAATGLFADVCAEHTRVLPDESYTTLPSPDDQLRAIALWQQKARLLQAEVVQRKRAEERLQVALAAEQAARKAAEDALSIRDEFIAVASHELKTPVTSLQGFAQLLHRRLMQGATPDPERLTRALTEMSSQAGRLTRLLNQLLDVSRLEAGKLTLEREPADLRELVETAVASAQARTDRHVISLAAPAATPALVDALRLEQVLTNLLDNAIKFSPDGGAIAVALMRSGSGEVRVTVRDHGLGIPLDRRDHIFERFYQAHANGHWGGLGLGLHISRQIVELHGGRIAAEFPPDGGTRFVVRLPVAADALDETLVGHEGDDFAATAAGREHQRQYRLGRE